MCIRVPLELFSYLLQSGVHYFYEHNVEIKKADLIVTFIKFIHSGIGFIRSFIGSFLHESILNTLFSASHTSS